MEEKLRILKMVEEGTLTAEQAGELLAALDESEKDHTWEGNLPVSVTDVSYDDRMLRVLVDSDDGDRVRVQFPVKAIQAIVKLTGKLPIQMGGVSEGVDVEALTETVLECLDSEMVGDIVSVESSDGDRVRIYID